MELKIPPVIAHRGASGHAPENTLAAIRLAAESGAQWIETDVNISRDGIPVLHHDDDLNRCSNGQGLVIEKTIDELLELDCGSWFGEQFSSEKIATLDQCLDLAISLGIGVNIEIKPCSGWEIPTTRQIADILNKRSSLPEILISSFSHVAMQHSADLLSQLPRASLFLVAPPDWLALTEEVGACAINLHANSLLNAESVRQFQDAGLGVYCYTVNTAPQALALRDLGVDGVFSNYPKLLLDAMD